MVSRVKALVRAYDYAGTTDDMLAYSELSQHSQRLSLLVAEADHAVFEDWLAIWNYARGSGLYRRAQALAWTQLGDNSFQLDEDPFKCKEETLRLEQWVRACSCKMAEKLRCELVSAAQGKQLHVLDSDVDGEADSWGTAITREAAFVVAQNIFADPISRVEFVNRPVRLRDGTVVQSAWLAYTVNGDPEAQAA